jgi:hypothetical protein
LVQLLRQDVRTPCRGRFDVTVALNFSYFVFRTREDLRGYFESVRRSMAADGIFVLDAYGGYQSWRPQTERRRLVGFTYVWEQATVDPIDHSVVNHIHFEFTNGTRMKRAFTYEWRLWTLPEIRELWPRPASRGRPCTGRTTTPTATAPIPTGRGRTHAKSRPGSRTSLRSAELR